jgi:hypothetical protein
MLLFAIKLSNHVFLQYRKKNLSRLAQEYEGFFHSGQFVTEIHNQESNVIFGIGWVSSVVLPFHPLTS